MNKVVNALLLCALLLLTSITASAATYGVGKLVYQLAPQAPIDTLTLTNNIAQPLFLQIKIMQWERNNGKDVYTPTKEVIAAPPIVNLGPKQQQIVRLAMRRPFTDHELKYRLFISDITPLPKNIDQQQTKKAISLNIKFKYVLPIYAAPITEKPDVSWNLISTANGLKVSAKNSGNTSLRIEKIVFADPKNDAELTAIDKGAIIFVGETHDWQLPKIKTASVKIKTYLENGATLATTITGIT